MPKVSLCGFLTMGNSTRVLLFMPPKDQKDTPKYLNLAPSEESEGLQLVKIDLKNEEVDIINSGTPMTLSLKSNGVAAMSAAAHPAGGAPPMPGMPGHRPPSLPQAPAAPAAASTPGGSSAIIVGGGDSGNASSYGSPIVAGGGSSGAAVASSSYNSPIVSGASPIYAPPNSANETANAAGVQIANALANPQTSLYRPPPPPAAPLVNQAANLIITHAAGGPPVPPGLENGGE